MHSILTDIKNVAQEFGLVPTRNFYREHGKFSDKDVAEYWPTFKEALKAAGIGNKPEKEVHHENAIKVTDRLIEFRNLNKYTPKTFGKTVLVIGDTHFPWHCPVNMQVLLSMVDSIQPDYVVQLGDLYDFYSFSKFPRSLNIYTPFDEVKTGFDIAKEMWAKILELSPRSECYQLMGNHDARPFKRVIESFPDGEAFFKFDEQFKFPGVTTIKSDRDYLKINGVIYVHGFKSAPGQHLAHFNDNVVFGHTHRSWVIGKSFEPTDSKSYRTKWEFNVGLFGDPNAKALQYTPSKVTHWVLNGVALIDDFGPRPLFY